MHSIFSITPPVLRVEKLHQIWAIHRPEVSPLLRQFDEIEDWVVPEVISGDDLPDAMSRILTKLSRYPSLNDVLARKLVNTLVYYNAEQSLYGLAWLYEHTPHAPPLVRWMLRHANDAAAHAMMQRIQAIAQHHVLNELLLLQHHTE